MQRRYADAVTADLRWSRTPGRSPLFAVSLDEVTFIQARRAAGGRVGRVEHPRQPRDGRSGRRPGLADRLPAPAVRARAQPGPIGVVAPEEILPPSTIRWWTSKSACSAFPRRRRFLRGGCSDCALRESAWSCHRPCITTTRRGSPHCGPAWKRRRPATRDTRRRRRDAGAASTALSPGRSTRSQASFATPRTSTIRGPMPRSPAPGAYLLTCEASEPSTPRWYASPCPAAAGLARPGAVQLHGCSAIATASQSAEWNASRSG